MGLKIVKSYDATFTLDSQAEEILFSLLTNPSFTEQVSQKLDQTGIRFTELCFNPSLQPATPRNAWRVRAVS